ncbi:MAG: prolyl oligopeptidase family serine peptidase [Jatrophihabitantaceae bacterium]
MLPQASRYPPAEPEQIAESISGRSVPDPYRWLETASSERTQRWLKSQSELYRWTCRSWRGAETFLPSLDRLTRFDLLSAPHWAGERAFFSCRGAAAQHTTLMVDEAGELRTLVDPQLRDLSGATVLGSWSPSPDGRLVAYQLATGGAEEFELYVLDVATGADIDGPLDGCRYSAVAWLPGPAAACYVVRRVGGRFGVYLHTVADPRPDRMVFGEGCPETAEFDVSVAPDGSRLVVLAWTGLSGVNELWHGEPAQPAAPALTRLDALCQAWNDVWPGRDGLLYVLTDQAAPRGRLVTVRPGAVAGVAEEPVTLIGEDDRAVLDGFAILDGAQLSEPLLLGVTSAGGLSRVRRYGLRSGGPLGEVELPGKGVVSELTCRPGGGHEAWLVYSDPLTPETVYRYDARTGDCAAWRGLPAMGIPAVEVLEQECRSSDGTAVRLTILRPTASEGRALPTILQGYGAFGEPQVADYYAAALAWVEQGGAFAMAAVRGGGEEGEDWHRAGMRENKQRSIEDFVAAGEHLIQQGYASADGLGAFGQSAGGLLVAAAMAQRPELFTAVAATAALLDMARYELSGMGPYWTEEFGSRNETTELDWLLGYSPYHRLKHGAEYPAVLLTAHDQDSRVDPLHSRKMCAALQHATSGPHRSRPVLLRYESGVGHGDRDRDGRLRYFAEVLAFFACYLNLPSFSS